MNDPQPNPPESNRSPESENATESGNPPMPESAPISESAQPKKSQPNNPLHGVTLKAMVEYLVEEYGWDRLGERIRIDCFSYDPSINSSLKFLRKTEWARAKVERLYLDSISYDERKGKKQAEPMDARPKTGNVWDQARRS
ncbi:VF530 family protein [Rhodopirellula islandica]|nr:VF530 family protein [Rhodopirellula islandica]